MWLCEEKNEFENTAGCSVVVVGYGINHIMVDMCIYSSVASVMFVWIYYIFSNFRSVTNYYMDHLERIIEIDVGYSFGAYFIRINFKLQKY